MSNQPDNNIEKLLEKRINELSQTHQGTDDDTIHDILYSRFDETNPNSPSIKTTLLRLYPTNYADMMSYVRERLTTNDADN